jgi:predicted transcriptional regulator
VIDLMMVGPYSKSMATLTIKTTYALDVETVRALEELARGWNVSKSEALRRAIRASAKRGTVAGTPDSVRALDRLQRSLRLGKAAAERWSKAVRAERKASSRRREGKAR